MVDAFLGDADVAAARRALGGEADLACPAILLAEAASAIRGMVLRRQVSDTQATTALREARALSITRFPFEPFVDRVWELRQNVTVYDAWYVALAEALDVPLLTVDRRLAEAPGPRCEVRLVRSP